MDNNADEKKSLQPRLTDASYVKSVMGKNNLNFKKKFGQNFLINASVPQRIADECGADENYGVLEIGPGIGTLTFELAAKAKKVVAVEIDSDLIPVLETNLCDFDNVKIINSDIMKLDVKKLIETEFPGMRVAVCANLPYYITTPILMQLIESGADFDFITVMVQKEVADRLCAEAGTENYGSITASISYYYSVRRLFPVSAGNFMPAPKVDSAVIRLDRYEKPPVDVKNPEFMFKVIKAAFAQRRKTLVNSLMHAFSDYSREELSAAVEKTGLAKDIRGERLDIKMFAQLSENILLIR